MKPLAYLGWFAGAAALAFAQNNTATASGALTAADFAAIRGLNDRYSQTGLDQAWPEWANLFAADALMMPPNSTAISGRASIEAWGRSLPRLTQFQNPIAEIDGAGDSAMVRGDYTLTLAPPNQPEQKDVGKWISIVRKQKDGTWKFHRCIFNSDLPVTAEISPSDAADIRHKITAAIDAALDATERRDEKCFASFSSAPEVRFATQGSSLTLAEFQSNWRKGIATSPRQEFSAPPDDRATVVVRHRRLDDPRQLPKFRPERHREQEGAFRFHRNVATRGHRVADHRCA